MLDVFELSSSLANLINRKTLLIIFALVYIPFILAKQISFMKYSSIVFAFALSVYAFIVIYNFINKYIDNTLPKKVNYFPNNKLLTFENVTLAFPLVTFTFAFTF